MKQPRALRSPAGARPADRQEHGALLPQARCSLSPPRRDGRRRRPDPAEVAADGRRRSPPCRSPTARSRGRRGAHRRLEPRRGGDGAARRRPGRGGRAGLRLGGPTQQRADGSWPMKIVAGEVEDASGETNMSAYLAVGVWHHWLVRRDVDFVRRLWPAVRRGLDWVVGMQLPFGGIAWSQEWRDGRPGAGQRRGAARRLVEHLPARCGPGWRSPSCSTSRSRSGSWPGAGSATRCGTHRDLFLDKSEFSMDWYYPVLGGAVRGDAGRALLDERWDTFVEPGLGIRCVCTNPWVTGAETCELVMALDALGDRERALRLLADMQHLRTRGRVLLDRLRLPRRRQLAGRADDLHRRRGDPGRRRAVARRRAGSDIMRGTTLAAGLRRARPRVRLRVSGPGRRRLLTSGAAPASSPAPRPR